MARRAYSEWWNNHVRNIENSFNKYGVDSTDLSTAEDYVKPLIKLFENR